MITSIINYFEKIETIDQLIKAGNTGTPDQLAEKLEVSVRQVYRLIELMKNLGADIEFCRYTQTYKYKQSVILKLGFEKSPSDN